MSDLAKAFLGIKQVKALEHPGTQAPRPPGTQAANGSRLALARLEGVAKSSNPEYAAIKVFLRRETHKAAGRKWQDEQDQAGESGDFSDLVEQLLRKYL